MSNSLTRGIAHVAITVLDLDATVSFFTIGIVSHDRHEAHSLAGDKDGHEDWLSDLFLEGYQKARAQREDSRREMVEKRKAQRDAR